jgi:hypothetical protein
MDRKAIDQYDLVEVVYVPEKYVGMIDVGDVGVVVKKHDDGNFEVECILPGGSSKWLATLNIGYIRLKSRDPFSTWTKQALKEHSITKPSVRLGTLVGSIFGALIGAGLGAITRSLNGILIGLFIGLFLGLITGALTAALTVKTAGTTGGVGVGYFTGMLFGGIFGLVLGVSIPTSLRMSARTENLPILDALAMGRFETAVFFGFVLSVLDTIVGVWIAGKNQVPRNLKERIDSDEENV